jgi:hypothetical protein
MRNALSKTTSFCTLALLGAASCAAQTPPSSPLPAALATAHKLFLGNAGDQENADCLRAYNDFYAGLVGLKRFDLVTDPNQADLVLELHYEFSLGAGVNGPSSANTPRQFRVLMIEPQHHIILWSLTERSNYALLQKNRDHNLDDTVAALINDFDVLTSTTPPKNHSVAHSPF